MLKIVHSKNSLLPLFLLIFAVNSYSVSFNPLVSDICSNNSYIKDKFKDYTAINASDEQIGVEITLKRVDGYDDKNNEIRNKVSSEITWYPKQFIMQAKTQKNFRVQVNMNNIPKKEHTYRIVVKEVPLNLTKNNTEESETNKAESSLKMIFSYEGLLFVKKCNYQHKLKVNYFTFNKKNNLIDLEIANTGKASIVPSFESLDIVLLVNKKEFSLKGKFKRQFRLYPDNKKKFQIKLLEPFLLDNMDNMKLILVNNK